MVHVFFSGALKAVTNGVARLELPDFAEGDLDTLLRSLAGRFGPSFSDRLTEDGHLRRYVNVFVNGEDVRFARGLQTPVGPADSVDFIPAVAGG